MSTDSLKYLILILPIIIWQGCEVEQDEEPIRYGVWVNVNGDTTLCSGYPTNQQVRIVPSYELFNPFDTLYATGPNMADHVLGWYESPGEVRLSAEISGNGTITIVIMHYAAQGGELEGVDTLRVTLTDCPPTIYIPNSFTPNHDGLNDLWTPQGTNIFQFRFDVHNEEGELIYASAVGNDARWDGNVDGSAAPTGNYQYFVYYRDIHGNRHDQHGWFELLR